MDGASEISEEKLRDILKKCNKCPACQEICLEDFPVITCNADHRLCKTCFVKSIQEPCSQCISKNDISTKNQNATNKLEPKSTKLEVYCRFSPNGCKLILPETKMKQHEQECKFRTIQCLGKTTDSFVCHWTGNQTNLLQHFSQAHKRNWNNMNYKYEGFIPVTAPKNLQVFKSHNKHFVYVYKHVKAMNKAFNYISYLGPQEEAKNYCYEMNFFIPNDPVSQLKFREICLPDDVPASDIIRSETCVVLSDNIRKRYTRSGKLHFRFWIKTTDIFGHPGYQMREDFIML